MKFEKWKDLEPVLTKAAVELAHREGSFSDGPWSPTENHREALSAALPYEEQSHAAVEAWIATGVLPAMPSPANRYTQIRFEAARGFAERLSLLPNCEIPREWTLQKLWAWLLFDVHADTVQVALDCMRQDLLGGPSDPNNGD